MLLRGMSLNDRFLPCLIMLKTIRLMLAVEANCGWGVSVAISTIRKSAAAIAALIFRRRQPAALTVCQAARPLSQLLLW